MTAARGFVRRGFGDAPSFGALELVCTCVPVRFLQLGIGYM